MFASVLGWRFEAFGLRYYRITAGDGDEPGIDGGVAATADVAVAGERPLTVVTVQVGLLASFAPALVGAVLLARPASQD